MLRSKTLKSLIVAMALGTCIFGGVQQAFADRTISVNVGTVDLALAGGGTSKGTIIVSNDGTEPFKTLVYTSNIKFDAQGKPEYTKPTGDAADMLKGSAGWISLKLATKEAKVIANTPYVDLKPGESMPVDWEMVVPADVPPGDYNCAVFFEMFNDPKVKVASGSRLAGRIGTRIKVRVAGDVYDRLDLAPFKVRGFVIGDVVPYSFKITNDGNIDKRYTPSLVVLSTSEEERMRTLVETNSVLYAKSARDYSGVLKLKDVWFGTYVVRAELAYDKETGSKPGATVPDKITKDRTIFVVPTWMVIALIIVLASPILWLSVRGVRRPKKAPKTEAVEAVNED